MNENIELFKSIASDDQLKDEEIRKYLGWSKGNLEQALNYYYRKKEKDQFKTKSQFRPTQH